MTEPLVQIKNLRVDIMSAQGVARAVRGVDMDIREGEIIGLVGESGCGKTITAKSIIRLNNDDVFYYRGEILFKGKDVFSLSEHEMTQLRGSGAAMVFQDPMSALDPLKRVGKQIEEVFVLRGANEKEAQEKTLALLEDVGIYPADERAKSYPFEMSGGQLQRVTLACALAGSPALLIADEPTTALDVTVQAQILKLLVDLRDKTGMALLVITHDFGIVAEICERVAVMYAGRIVEIGGVREVFHSAKHPYTRDLIRSIPKSGGGSPVHIPGAPPDLRSIIKGCSYAPRCAFAKERCGAELPPLAGAGEHKAACFFEGGANSDASSEAKE